MENKKRKNITYIDDPDYDCTNYSAHKNNNSGNCNELLDNDDNEYYGQDHPYKPPN